MGSGSGSVGRVVVSDPRGPPFDSRRWQSFIWNICLLSTVKKETKRGREWPPIIKTHPHTSPILLHLLQKSLS